MDQTLLKWIKTDPKEENGLLQSALKKAIKSNLMRALVNQTAPLLAQQTNGQQSIRILEEITSIDRGANRIRSDLTEIILGVS